MIYFAQRVIREETTPDKREFVRGATGMSKPTKAGLAKIATGVLIGRMLTTRRGK